MCRSSSPKAATRQYHFLQQYNDHLKNTQRNKRLLYHSSEPSPPVQSVCCRFVSPHQVLPRQCLVHLVSRRHSGPKGYDPARREYCCQCASPTISRCCRNWLRQLDRLRV